MNGSVESARDRVGLHAVLAHARGGDVIVVHTLHRVGRTVRAGYSAAGYHLGNSGHHVAAGTGTR